MSCFDGWGAVEGRGGDSSCAQLGQYSEQLGETAHFLWTEKLRHQGHSVCCLSAVPGLGVLTSPLGTPAVGCCGGGRGHLLQPQLHLDPTLACSGLPSPQSHIRAASDTHC